MFIYLLVVSFKMLIRVLLLFYSGDKEETKPKVSVVLLYFF